MNGTASLGMSRLPPTRPASWMSSFQSPSLGVQTFVPMFRMQSIRPGAASPWLFILDHAAVTKVYTLFDSFIICRPSPLFFWCLLSLSFPCSQSRYSPIPFFLHQSHYADFLIAVSPCHCRPKSPSLSAIPTATPHISLNPSNLIGLSSCASKL